MNARPTQDAQILFVEMVNRRSGVVAFGGLLLLLVVLLLLVEPTFEQTTQPRLSSPAEFTALLELRSSLGLRSKEWPIKSDPCWFWRGVQCRNGSVVGINISGFRRTRLGSRNPQFVVDALANLTLLESFNASRFLLPGSIPDWVGGRLSSLKMLDLRSCSVTGSIPLGLGNLSNLDALFLSDNNLTGSIPFSLGQLSRLSILDLSQNRFTGSIPSSFGSFRNLSVLNISINFLSGTIPPGIGTISSLQYLNLSGNSLSSSIPAQLGDLDNLVELDLSFNTLSGSLPADLRGLRNLQKMVFRKNLLAGSLPGNLFPAPSQLQQVVLSRNSFTGNLPDVLWTMPSLSFLDVSENNFTGLLPNFSFNANATAAVFNLSQNMFYGGLPSLPRRFNFIDMSGNYFEGRVSGYAPSNASFGTNCLQNMSNQRTLEVCASFYAERGLTFDNFGQPNGIPPTSNGTSRKSNKKWIILAGVLGGFGLILFLVVVLVLFVCCRRRGLSTQRGNGVGPVPAGGSPPPPGMPINFLSLGEAFTYQQILQATSDFSDANFIKHGHSGDFYWGTLEGGIRVVIKRIDLSSIKKEAYLLELDFFSKVSHARFVPLLGQCLENDNEKFLVYKYMPNGDLSNSLYRKSSSEDDGLQSLDWITRLKIAIGAAEALSYLHHECNPPIVHRYIITFFLLYFVVSIPFDVCHFIIIIDFFYIYSPSAM